MSPVTPIFTTLHSSCPTWTKLWKSFPWPARVPPHLVSVLVPSSWPTSPLTLSGAHETLSRLQNDICCPGIFNMLTRNLMWWWLCVPSAQRLILTSGWHNPSSLLYPVLLLVGSYHSPVFTFTTVHLLGISLFLGECELRGCGSLFCLVDASVSWASEFNPYRNRNDAATIIHLLYSEQPVLGSLWMYLLINLLHDPLREVFTSWMKILTITVTRTESCLAGIPTLILVQK